MCNAHNHEPWCDCGFGGATRWGHYGDASHYHKWLAVGIRYHSVDGHHYWSDYESSFCRPSTCPYCHAKVFFVRHNGGCVWLDDLGHPWPKHGCFYTDTFGDDHSRNVVARIHQYAAKESAGHLSAIVEVGRFKHFDKIKVTVAVAKQAELIDIRLQVQNVGPELLGTLLLLDANGVAHWLLSGAHTTYAQIEVRDPLSPLTPRIAHKPDELVLHGWYQVPDHGVCCLDWYKLVPGGLHARFHTLKGQTVLIYLAVPFRLVQTQRPSQPPPHAA